MLNMKVVYDIGLCSVVLCAVWSTVMCAVTEEMRPPLASYNYGLTGEPSKIDTAFGNAKEVGPRYDVPSGNETTDEVPSRPPNPIATSSEEGMNQNIPVSEGSEEPQVTNESSSAKPPTQSFNTSNTPTTTLTSTTTEKSIVPSKTTNGSATAAGDNGTTTPIEMSTTQTGSPMEASTNAAIPSGQSVSPSQSFETGKPTRKPTAGPGPIGNSTEPGQRNGTATVGLNSSIVLKPLTTIYCLVSVAFLISKMVH